MALAQRTTPEKTISSAIQQQPKLRVLYIVSLFPCWSETFIVREIEKLLEKGVEVRIFSLKPPQEKLVQSDARVLERYADYPVSFLSNLIGVVHALSVRPKASLGTLFDIITDKGIGISSRLKSIVVWWRVMGVADRYRDWQPSMIHAHWATYPSTGAMLLSGLLDIPFSFTSHAHDIFLEKHLLDKKLKTSQFAVTISEYNRRILEQSLPAEQRKKIHVIHCGINPEELPYKENDRDPTLLLAVGRLDEIKGFPILVQACAWLHDQGKQFRCEIIGEGPLRQSLQQAINDKGLQDVVKLCGAMPYEKVRARLYEASVFVLPSVITAHGNMDGIPVALMEAMACGAPVVSTTVSGIPELVEDGENGYLVPPEDARALGERLSSLLDKPEKRIAFARKARQRVEKNFSVATEAEKLQKLFGSVSGSE